MRWAVLAYVGAVTWAAQLREKCGIHEGAVLGLVPEKPATDWPDPRARDIAPPAFIDVIGAVNGARKKQGRCALCLAPDLVLSAAAHAAYASRLGEPVLSGPDLRGYGVYRSGNVTRVVSLFDTGARPSAIVKGLLGDYYNSRSLTMEEHGVIGAAYAPFDGERIVVVVHLARALRGSPCYTAQSNYL